MKTKAKVISNQCGVMRVKLVTHTTFDMRTGAKGGERQEWVTEPCGTPMFGDREKADGMCRGCASGWNHPENYRADGPRPNAVVKGGGK